MITAWALVFFIKKVHNTFFRIDHGQEVTKKAIMDQCLELESIFSNICIKDLHFETKVVVTLYLHRANDTQGIKGPRFA